MRIGQVEIANFRLLSDATLALEDTTTVIVGRNNSGKTSLSEVMRRLLAEGNASFELEDFSSASYDAFCSALAAHVAGESEPVVRDLLPAIGLRFTCHYDAAQPELGPLAPFVIDLDPACEEALISVRYELKDGAIATLFHEPPAIPLTDEGRLAFFRSLRDRIPTLFTTRVWAEDPNDATNRRPLQVSALRNLVKTGFINAQRGLDDIGGRETDVLAKVLEGLFSTATAANSDDGDRAIATALTSAVEGIQTELDNNFGGQLQKLMPTLQSFGYPGLGGQEIQTETILDVRRLLSNFTRVRYAGHGGIALPESYNGLGVRNLIFILLQLVGFYRAYRADDVAAGVHLIFIEEPEAHLHPQMQEVFIRRLDRLAKRMVEDSEDKAPWPVQFVVSTHSSHIANEAGFSAIRYFLSASVPGAKQGVRSTRIKDLRQGLSGVSAPDRAFLHQYMTLTRCDLFFADKAVLVEGLSERLMLPVIIEKLEAAEPDTPRLSSQYLSVMEVGGAHAHRFFDLLEFLELRTLVITDLDAVEKAGGSACAVHAGTTSSNNCIKAWFAAHVPLTLDALHAMSEVDKIRDGRRIAYQCVEGAHGPCGRTFEDAFILANAAKFGLGDGTAAERETQARGLAAAYKKSDFALQHAIVDKAWVTPVYLADGVRWLAGPIEAPTDPALAAVVAVAAGDEPLPEGSPNAE